MGVDARGRVSVPACACASTTMRACLRVLGRGCDKPNYCVPVSQQIGRNQITKWVNCPGVDQ